MIENYMLPSLFDVDSLAITHNCWLYVDNKGVFIINGPVAISLPFKCAFCSIVDVIGGPLKVLIQRYLSVILNMFDEVNSAVDTRILLFRNKWKILVDTHLRGR